ncbi:MAG: MazG-like family protein [Candidatus Pacebacteria bacterium]|nr:MazG-like family protein [Candidatus Paceibacterota bacterium]MBP9842960.1 MazG-like family protein [Candidatus Paceibacterota bacterium]
MIEKISTRLQKIDNYFREISPDWSERERLFSRVVKLNEEVGELCEAVLYENDTVQRTKDKVIDLDSELADVIICTLLLAHNREKDIWIEVDKKLTKQMGRFNLE